MMMLIIIRPASQGAPPCSPPLLSRRLSSAACITAGSSSASTFLVALTTAGAMGLPGALLRPLQREFGWSEAEHFRRAGVAHLAFGLMAPFAAALIERYGLKRVILSAMAMIVAGLDRRAVHDQALAACAAVGRRRRRRHRLTAMVMGAIVSTRWFVERRGLVVGILGASIGDRPARVPAARGVRWRRIGAGAGRWCRRWSMLALAGVAVVLLMADRPADLGLPPYGATRDRAGADDAACVRRGAARAARSRARSGVLGAGRFSSSSAGSRPTA